MGQLYARVGGAWVPVLGNDEVWVGDNAPVDPSTELWIDTDDPGPVLANVPLGVRGRAVATGSAYTNATVTATDITVTAGQPPSLSLALDTTRYYRATFSTNYHIGDTTTRAIISFVVGGTPQRVFICPWANVANNGMVATFSWLFIPASAALTVYKMMARASVAGAGMGFTFLSAADQMEFVIEDAGAV